MRRRLRRTRPQAAVRRRLRRTRPQAAVRNGSPGRAALRKTGRRRARFPRRRRWRIHRPTFGRRRRVSTPSRLARGSGVWTPRSSPGCRRSTSSGVASTSPATVGRSRSPGTRAARTRCTRHRSPTSGSSSSRSLGPVASHRAGRPMAARSRSCATTPGPSASPSGSSTVTGRMTARSSPMTA